MRSRGQPTASSVRTIRGTYELTGLLSVKASGAVELGIGSTSCPRLKAELAGSREWRVTQAVATFKSANSAEPGLISMLVCPHDWNVKDMSAIRTTGGTTFNAGKAIAKSNTFGQGQTEWLGTANYYLTIRAAGTADIPNAGVLSVTMTYQTRGFSS